VPRSAGSDRASDDSLKAAVAASTSAGPEHQGTFPNARLGQGDVAAGRPWWLRDTTDEPLDEGRRGGTLEAGIHPDPEEELT